MIKAGSDIVKLAPELKHLDRMNIDTNGMSPRLDDLIKHTDGKVYTYLAIGGGDFESNYSTVGGPGNYVLYADVSGDGKTDLVKYNASGWV